MRRAVATGWKLWGPMSLATATIGQIMDWFERLTGYKESTGLLGYEQTRQRLQVDGQVLTSLVNGHRYGIGRLELGSMAALRRRAQSGARVPGQRQLRVARGHARAMHAEPEYVGALFQVASQFNLLEMVGPEVTPEHGVTRYEGDRTQGPACAIAAGAATVYRNYFVTVGDATGQTRNRQLDTFAGFGAAVAHGLGRPGESLWTMRNGYAMFTRASVDLMSSHVQSLDTTGRDEIRQHLQIGLHWDVEVTDADATPGPTVSQAFCSALPVSYNNLMSGTRGAKWAPLAQLVLEAAYEATLWAAVLNAQRGVSNTVLLTLLGGGAFRNEEGWILAAMQHALQAVSGHGLDIVIVSYGTPSADLQLWVAKHNAT